MSTCDLKDLHSLLRFKLGDQLIIESCEIEDFLPPGENYGSKIVSVNAVIRRNKKSNSEDLQLVAKLPPPTQAQREMFDSPYTFKKESFMYEEIFPAYKQLELDNGLSEDEICNVDVIFYGSRMSLYPFIDFDDNAAILLENLKKKNYYIIDRRKGLNLSHAKSAVIALAKFHALGMAMKEKNSEFFEILKKRSKCLQLKTSGEEWKGVVEQRLKDISEDEIMSRHYDACEKAFKSGDASSSWTMVPTEPWSTINHSDFWTNNILFHKKKNSDEPDDVKFIDFQNYLFLSPTRDLTFFIGCGLDHDVMINDVDKLIDLYYENLILRLRRLNCDTSQYSRESFDKQVKADAYIEIQHSMCMLKIITMEFDENDSTVRDVLNVFKDNRKNHLYIERMRNLVHVFFTRGWLEQ